VQNHITSPGGWRTTTTLQPDSTFEEQQVIEFERENPLSAAEIKKARRGFRTTCFSEIEPREIDWLWEKRLAIGKVNLLAGPGGLGKTYLTCGIISTVTNGGTFVDGAKAAIGDVLFVSAEDDPEDTIRPRLDLMGADVSRVHWLDCVNEGGREGFLDIRRHHFELDDYLTDNPSIRLLVVDPLSAFLGSTDSHNDGSVRGVLGPLAAVLRKHGVAGLCVAHVAKSQEKRRGADRILGSVGFVNAARSCWHVEPDRDDKQRRLFLPGKTNFEQATGLAFTITNRGIEWEPGEIDMTIDDYLGAAPRPQTEVASKAAKFLINQIPAGNIVRPKVILDAAKEAGVSTGSLYRAADSLEIIRSDEGWCHGSEFSE